VSRHLAQIAGEAVVCPAVRKSTFSVASDVIFPGCYAVTSSEGERVEPQIVVEATATGIACITVRFPRGSRSAGFQLLADFIPSLETLDRELADRCQAAKSDRE